MAVWTSKRWGAPRHCARRGSKKTLSPVDLQPAGYVNRFGIAAAFEVEQLVAR
jgi:hypothetical protein